MLIRAPAGKDNQWSEINWWVDSAKNAKEADLWGWGERQTCSKPFFKSKNLPLASS